MEKIEQIQFFSFSSSLEDEMRKIANDDSVLQMRHLFYVLLLLLLLAPMFVWFDGQLFRVLVVSV